MCAAPEPAPSATARRQRGVTLVEVIIFIVIVSTAVVAVCSALALTVRQSADPLVMRQALAVAESLTQEIDNLPYAQHEPYSPYAIDSLGPESGESRSGASQPYDNPNDYSGYSETGIVVPGGGSVSGLSAYSASVTGSQQAMDNIPSGDGLLMVVTATGPDGQPVTITTFRAMYAP